MLRVEEWRAKAQECDENASEVRDMEIRHMFENLADHWRRVADQAERYRDSPLGRSGFGRRSTLGRSDAPLHTQSSLPE